MPRFSYRHSAITWMTRHVTKLRKQATHRELMDDEDSLEDDHLCHVEHHLRQMKATHYLFRDVRYRKRKN
jgi:hypothetical protein